MVQAVSQGVGFDELIKWYPENSEHRYELHDGVIVEMPLPKGGHEEVVGFLVKKLNVEFDRSNLPYFVPKTVIIKPPHTDSGYLPDVLVLNRSNLVDEPVWQDESVVTRAVSISLAIEVVNTNWRDDYLKKYADREEMGIFEYWIVDYLALGGREFIGKPKQPTILICFLDEGEYQINKFRDNERLECQHFLN